MGGRDDIETNAAEELFAEQSEHEGEEEDEEGERSDGGGGPEHRLECAVEWLPNVAELKSPEDAQCSEDPEDARGGGIGAGAVLRVEVERTAIGRVGDGGGEGCVEVGCEGGD